MEIVNVIHKMADKLRSLIRDRGAAGRLEVAELEAEPDHAEQEAEHEAPEGAGLVGSCPEYSQEEHGCDLWGQEVGYGLLRRSGIFVKHCTITHLNVDKQLGGIKVLNNGNPSDADSHQEDDKGSAHHEELGL